MSKNTLNIYEVLEALNKKINNNTTLIEDNNEQLKASPSLIFDS